MSHDHYRKVPIPKPKFIITHGDNEVRVRDLRDLTINLSNIFRKDQTAKVSININPEYDRVIGKY
jgi:hypothetical protein